MVLRMYILRSTYLDVPRHAGRCYRLPELVPPLRVEAMPVPGERHLLGAERLTAGHLHLRKKKKEKQGIISYRTFRHGRDTAR